MKLQTSKVGNVTIVIVEWSLVQSVQFLERQRRERRLDPQLGQVGRRLRTLLDLGREYIIGIDESIQQSLIQWRCGINNSFVLKGPLPRSKN